MDLIGIFHVVNTLSSGKHDFNHIYVVDLIQSILILSFSGVHLMFMFWKGYCPMSAGFSCPFLTVCVFLSDPRCCPVFSRNVCLLCGHLFCFPWMTMV